MQLFRPTNEYQEQTYIQSAIKPFFGTKPTGYGGGNNLTHCQTQTQCFDAQLPGAGSGYGSSQYAAGAQGYGQHAQHGTYGAVQHGGTTGAMHQSSNGGMMQGGGYGGGHANMAHHQQGGYALSHGTAHHGSSFGSGCAAPAGGYSYTMKKKERRTYGRKRSGNGNDSDSSGSDESDNEKC